MTEPGLLAFAQAIKEPTEALLPALPAVLTTAPDERPSAVLKAVKKKNPEHTEKDSRGSGDAAGNAHLSTSPMLFS